MKKLTYFILLLSLASQCIMANCQDSISVSQDKLTIAKLYYDSAFLCLSNKDYYSAMPKLIKTAALVENLPEDMTDEEIHLTSRAYYQMAYVFQKMIMTSYAVETALRASQYQDMRQDTAWMLFTKIRLAEYYQVTKNKDSVDYYLKQVIPLSDSVKYTYEYNTALRLAARNYYDKEEYDTAFILYKDIINFKHRHGMTTLNDSISLGILMFHSPYEYQSKPYLAKAFDKIERNPSANMRDMGLIFFLLSKLYEKEGNSDSVSICHKLMPEFIDYMAEEKSDELKLELMYNNFKTERDQRLYELRLQKEKIRNRNVAIYCVFALSILSGITIILKRRNRKKLDDVSDYNKKWKSIEQNELLQCVRSRLVTDNGEKISVKNIEKYSDRSLSSIELMELRRLIDTTFNGLVSRLSERYPELNKVDIYCCCLSLLGLTNSEMAVLLGVRYSAISTRINSIKKIFGTEESIGDFVARYYSEM